MRINRVAVLGTAIALLTGCGGGSSNGEGGNGGLSFRALWQQPAATSAAVRVQPQAVAGFASGLPASVKTIRLVFNSDGGASCCTAIDPTQVPVDSSGGGAVVLDSLPAGGATLALAGFPTTFAPAPTGVTQQCAVNPASAGKTCDPSRSANPNYQSNPQRVTIIANQEVDAGDILLFAAATPTPHPGASPTATPTGTPLPSTTIIVRPGTDIGTVIRQAPAGSLIIVSPGLYGPVRLGNGDVQSPVTLLADVTGTLTGSAASPVTIRASDSGVAVQVVGITDLTLDGFSMRSSGNGGVLVADSVRVVVRNCTVSSISGDGIEFDESDDGLIFDNLVFNNTGAGIRIINNRNVRVVNNTLYKNEDAGLAVVASEGTMALNNIVNSNTPVGITVDTVSAADYDGNFNMNSDGYGDGTPIGARDLNGPTNSDPLFVTPQLGNFHLQKGLAGSVSPAIDAGSAATDPALVQQLQQRTTQTDGMLDIPPVDLGYHYVGSGTAQ